MFSRSVFLSILYIFSVIMRYNDCVDSFFLLYIKSQIKPLWAKEKITFKVSIICLQKRWCLYATGANYCILDFINLNNAWTSL